MTDEQKPNHAFARSRSNAGLGSAFQQAVHHAYAQTDGTYAWPNSREGDMLREAKREIEQLRNTLQTIAEDATFPERAMDVARSVLMPNVKVRGCALAQSQRSEAERSGANLTVGLGRISISSLQTLNMLNVCFSCDGYPLYRGDIKTHH